MANASTKAELSIIETKLDRVIKDVESVNAKLERKYVTHDEHELVKQRLSVLEKIMWSIVGTGLLAVVGAIMKVILI